MPDQVPRFLVYGGEVFDKVAGAPSEVQNAFLHILMHLRRDPYGAAQLNIEPARGSDTPNAFMAALNGVDLSYRVVDEDNLRFILLVAVLWI